MTTLQKAALLTLLPTISKINSTECMFAFQDAFEVHLDHHEFAYYLDELRTKGLLDHKGIDTCGRNEYTLTTTDSSAFL